MLLVWKVIKDMQYIQIKVYHKFEGIIRIPKEARSYDASTKKAFLAIHASTTMVFFLTKMSGTVHIWEFYQMYFFPVSKELIPLKHSVCRH